MSSPANSTSWRALIMKPVTVASVSWYSLAWAITCFSHAIIVPAIGCLKVRFWPSCS